MKKMLCLSVIPLALLCWPVDAQTYDTNGVVVQTFAGSGFSGYVDGVGQLTMFNSPNAIVADSHGSLFVWDSNNYRIRKVTPDGTVTTFAGGGNQATGVGTNVNLVGDVHGMTTDQNDTIWMVSYDVLYKITSSALVTRTSLPILFARGICADSQGNLYISGGSDNKIYRYTTNAILSVFAGSGNLGRIDGNGIFTSFQMPAALAADAADNIYVMDWGNNLLRKVDQSQNVTTLAGKFYDASSVDGVGTNAGFAPFPLPSQMCVDGAGNLLLACGSAIRRMNLQTRVTTIAGSFSQQSYANGAGNLARFSVASGVCFLGGTIYVADSGNQRIRSITNTPTEQPVLPANLQLNTYPGLQITGTVGRTYRVESSPDTSNWTTRATLLLTSSPYLWFDQNPVSGSKFYRALLLP